MKISSIQDNSMFYNFSNKSFFRKEMADSGIFPRGTIIKKVYSYNFEYENKEVSVVFLNYGHYQQTGADHSCALELRNDFARQLLEIDTPTPSPVNYYGCLFNDKSS